MFSVQCNHRSDSSPVVYERPARSVPGFALITAPVLTFLFTGRDAAITVNSVKIDITVYHAVVVLADRTTACSMIGYHSNS